MSFFGWYNDEHRHSGIGFHTAAYAEHPERFVRKPPEPPKLPTAAWINQPKEEAPTTQ